MQTFRIRTLVIGGGTGLVVGLLFAFLPSPFAMMPIVDVLISIGLGVLFARLFQTANTGNLIDHVAYGAMFGLANGLLMSLLLVPFVTSGTFGWTADGTAASYAAIVSSLFWGMSLGIAQFVAFEGARAIYGEVELPEEAVVDTDVQQRVVILGGGFVGTTAAQTLDKLVGPNVEVTLISDTTHLLFTPMLTEVVAGEVEGQHISPSLRTFFKHVNVVQGVPVGLDPNGRTVTVETQAAEPMEFAYDHLVLSLGAVPNYFGNENIARDAFAFKSLEDAMFLRDHIIRTLERADTEPDPAMKRALLTFVIAGGGFSGAELAGGLNDFVRGSARFYRNIRSEDVRVVVVHARDHILPELSESLGRYAQEKMAARGVEFILNTRVTDTEPGVVYAGDHRLVSETFVWTAGNLPNPLPGQFGLPVNKRGAVQVTEQLNVEGYDHIWAAGDGAAVPDVVTGEMAPPTAQYATREAKTVAENIHAVINGDTPEPFKHRSQGTLAVLGHQIAAAEIQGVKFSGLLAWFLWRGVYIAKLPTLEKRIRVLLDWTVALFFPQDITSIQPLPVRPKMNEPKRQKEVV